jgi:TonB family protein
VSAAHFIGKRSRLTWLVSIALHGAVMASLWAGAHRLASSPGAPSDRSDPARLPRATVGDDSIAVDPTSIDPFDDSPHAPVANPVARPDTGDPGRGGESTANAPAVNLADADERMRQSPDLLSRLDRDQLQRLRVARARFSWEDRRSTTHPAELTLVTTGPGSVRERRAWAATRPNRGLQQPSLPSDRGVAAPGSLVQPSDDPEARALPGGARVGAIETSAGEGLPDSAPGLGDHRPSAPVGMARPAIVAGPVAVSAIDRARPLDDLDSEQEVATTVRSLIHASTAGGLPGQGEGGSGGGDVAGAGGRIGPTSVARPLRGADGDVVDYWTHDAGLLSYFRQLHGRIDPMWAHAFPKSALFDLRQGTVILDFTVFPDGRVSVAWPPFRPSGVDEFDRNCAEAIRRAAPFPPIPRALGVKPLHVRAPFVASNPIVK